MSLLRQLRPGDIALSRWLDRRPAFDPTLTKTVADIIADLVDGHAGPGARLDLVAVHGQTVCHDPPLSWQLVNPAPIVRRLAVPVVSDLRQADLAAGGQGAPITPLAEELPALRELNEIDLEDKDARIALLNDPAYCKRFRRMWYHDKKGFSLARIKRCLEMPTEH